MPKLIIPVGLPGCGKTSFGHVFSTKSTKFHETDAIRVELTGDMQDMSQNAEVFDTWHTRIEQDLHDGWDVYADATNLRDWARKSLCSIAERVGAETHLFVFENTTEAIERNKNRERPVPSDVMIAFVSQFERAIDDIYNDESYDAVTYIWSIQ